MAFESCSSPETWDDNYRRRLLCTGRGSGGPYEGEQSDWEPAIEESG